MYSLQVNEPLVLFLTRHSELAQVPLLDSDRNTPLMYLLRDVRGCRSKLVRMLLQHSPLDASQWLNLQQSLLQADSANQHRNIYGESLYDLFCLERNLSIFGDMIIKYRGMHCIYIALFYKLMLICFSRTGTSNIYVY